MRLWSLHPSYLDAKGLVAAWREALLAQKVLAGRTKGYRNHPQLIRFRSTTDPIASIGYFLKGIHEEACKRGYRFDLSRILKKGRTGKIKVTRGQVKFEFNHLLRKLEKRDKARYREYFNVKMIALNRLFRAVPGGIEPWEKSRL
jgi:hypothetical protein